MIVSFRAQPERTGRPGRPAGDPELPYGIRSLRVLRQLREPMHQRDLADVLGWPVTTTQYALWNLRRAGKVRSLGAGRWERA